MHKNPPMSYNKYRTIGRIFYGKVFWNRRLPRGRRMMNKTLVQIEHLKQYFPGGIRAVDDVSLQIHRGETLGPGGSVRDDNVIATCNKYDMAMAFTGIRLFHH